MWGIFRRELYSTKRGEIQMWYVMYCPKSNEEEIINSCRSRINSQILNEAFMFTYEKLEKSGGIWRIKTRKMFPNYVFLDSDDGEALYDELDRYRDFLQVLEQDRELLHVKKEEEKLLRELCGKEHHMAMSRGEIKQSVTHVMEGPLMGKESLIVRIDRHKRLAYLNSEIFSWCKDMKAGLEIVEKAG